MRWVTLVLLAVLFSGCIQKKNPPTIEEFLNLRKEGKALDAYKLLDSASKKEISPGLFEKYCFVYRIIDFKLEGKKKDFTKIVYTFYDKKFKKEDPETLHTYYINENSEYIRVSDKGIHFPHPLFLKLREAIEQHDLDKAKNVVKKMLSLSPGQPDVLETAGNLQLL